MGGRVGERAVTAVMITLNEEHNLPYVLRSVRPWCEQVIVVDMMSDDRTVEIAQQYADLVLPHERIEAFDAARELGVKQARNEWILSIDADEVVTPQLADWIRDFVESDPPFDVAYIPRVNVFLGQWIRSSNWWPGHPRLFRREAIEISGRLHRGLWPKAGSRVKRLPRDPQLSMWHFSYLSLESLTQKTNHYTSIEARQHVARGKPAPLPRYLFTKALKGFWREYILRRGYRDGMAGLTFALNRVYYRYLAMAKRWDESQVGLRQARYDRMRERILSGFPAAPGGPASRPAASELPVPGASEEPVRTEEIAAAAPRG
jgi:glycosyltransferase involved in cell wall biosynthesis